MQSKYKHPNENLELLNKILNNSIVISNEFKKYVLNVASKSIEANYVAGEKNDNEDYTYYKMLMKELHTITIFSSYFQETILGTIHDCIMSAYEEGQKKALKD